MDDLCQAKQAGIVKATFLDDGLKRAFAVVVAEFHPRAKTWRWKVLFVNVRQTLDHIFYDHRLTPLDAWVHEGGRSDHLPVVAIFEGSATAD